MSSFMSKEKRMHMKEFLSEKDLIRSEQREKEANL